MRRMKKRLGAFFVMVCAMFLLTGCRMYVDYTVNGDGTLTAKSTIAYTEEEMETIGDDPGEGEWKTLEDGKRYFVDEPDIKTASTDEFEEEEGIWITEDMCIYDLSSLFDEDMQDFTDTELYMQMSVTFGKEIVSTNGKLSEDRRTVTFDTELSVEEAYWYAYTEKGNERIKSDHTAPKMKGAKAGKCYKLMPLSIEFVDEIRVAEIRLNGQVVTPISATYVDNEGKDKKCTIWYTRNGKKPEREGKNTFLVKDLSGNTASYSFYIDKKPPVIKGVKNNKSYKKKAVVYVKDKCKLSKVTINGKKQKMTDKQLVKKGKYKGYYKYTVKKKGTNRIVVKDKAGNKKTVKIRIR